MAHHAYYLVGDLESGISASLEHIRGVLGLATEGNPDVTVLRFDFFGVDDARRLIAYASQSDIGGAGKAIVVAAARIYHEAQNALLKLFEEPTEGTTLFLVVPSEAVLLPTLRSRLISLASEQRNADPAFEFLELATAERRKHVERLIDRTRSDKDEVKQRARREMLELLQGITRICDMLPSGEERRELLRDLDTFTRALHARAAPQKPVFEHLLQVLPGPEAFHRPKV